MLLQNFLYLVTHQGLKSNCSFKYSLSNLLFAILVTYISAIESPQLYTFMSIREQLNYTLLLIASILHYLKKQDIHTEDIQIPKLIKYTSVLQDHMRRFISLTLNMKFPNEALFSKSDRYIQKVANGISFFKIFKKLIIFSVNNIPRDNFKKSCQKHTQKLIN